MTYNIRYNGTKNKDGWQCFAWVATFSDKVRSIEVEYFTGLGHATKVKHADFAFIPKKPKSLKNKKVIKEGDLYIHVPKLNSILHSLAMDAQCGQDSFTDFCSNFGYDTDSRKAMDIYLACQSSQDKLRAIMKSRDYFERILAWEL